MTTGQPHVLGLARGADGYYILEMLGLDGWRIAVTAHAAGVKITARRGKDVVERVGASAADIALQVYEAARAISRAPGR